MKKLLLGLVVVVLLAAGVGAAYYFYKRDQAGDIRGAFTFIEPLPSPAD